ncbi:response regulator [Pantanalinema rosaneae CENA516]|uniref:hybrid sensor histidine kinase/response regulator n=1 Tax=Pantanalinema rosaneae TaxID=1620701 RepID=UPI003D6DDD69
MMQPKLKETILIVDDVPTNIKVLVNLLDESGLNIAVAKNGESALEKVHKVAPDLILLDVMMPGIDGFETCKRLKADARTKEIPIIFMTALSDPVDKIKGLQLGAVDYVTKPIHQEEVLARINVHLDLRRARLRLVREEKLASLGQLVAGLAHEINNPVNFIHGNLAYVQRYSHELLEAVKLYQSQCSIPTPEIQAFSEQVDLSFIQIDLPKLLTSIELGTRRIQELVRSLRIFSRLDEADYKAVDLHEGLESTLMLLSSQLEAKAPDSAITVTREYTELPLVECYAGEMNQVFMNLLTNAIDAIEDKLKLWRAMPHPELPYYIPNIHLQTVVLPEQQQIAIRIADNGIGMSETVQQKLFDPFFTTKAIGRGTGLGLAIVHQIIVEQHRGTLRVKSTPEQGTELIVSIPMRT